MVRKLLLFVLPIVLPLLTYWLYMFLARRKAALARNGDLPGWQDAPWTLIAASAFVLMLGGLVFFRFTDTLEPGTDLIPPRYIDGEVEPSRVAD